MKNIFFIFLLGISLSSLGQALSADPAVDKPMVRSIAGQPSDANLQSNQPILLRIPVYNNSFTNPIPNGSTRLTIGLGSKLEIDPGFNVATSRLSEYFSFSSSFIGGQVVIVGNQIKEIPIFFGDSTEFRVRGNTLGQSTINANISPVTNAVDDRDFQNNNASLPYTITSLSVLPVTLTQFDVVKTGCNIDVLFTTSVEINLSRYEVEVSKNGIDFMSVGSISARNATKYSGTYPITDRIKATSLYVRLKSIDKDETFAYSSVKRIAGTCDSRRTLVLRAFPNPIRFGRTLTVTSTEGSFEGKYTISVIDMSGRTLQSREMQLNNVSNFRFDIGSISSGQYLLKVANTDQTESSVIRFQKQ